MSRLKWSLILLVISALALGGWQSQEATKIDDAGLRGMLTGLGYEVKEPGASTFEVPISNAGLNIPTRVFLAKSKSKIWLSVALMTKDGVDKLTQEDLRKLLEKNVEVGPCHFMIEGGWLKMKMAIDNRNITPVILRAELEYLANRVADAKPVWQK